MMGQLDRLFERRHALRAHSRIGAIDRILGERPRHPHARNRDAGLVRIGGELFHLVGSRIEADVVAHADLDGVETGVLSEPETLGERHVRWKDHRTDALGELRAAGFVNAGAAAARNSPVSSRTRGRLSDCGDVGSSFGMSTLPTHSRLRPYR